MTRPRKGKGAGDGSSTQLDLDTRAYLQIRDLISNGRIAPGTRIIESELAERLQFSRTPIRGALRRLQQEGWVTASETPKQVRLVVSPLTEADARELFEIIGVIEGVAAAWAAKLPAERRKNLVAELGAINAALRAEASSSAPDAQSVFELHSSFHVLLVEAVNAPRLRALHDSIKPQAYRYRRIYSTALIPVTPDAAAEHEALLVGIDSGSPEEAERAARVNWTNAAARMAQIIDSWGEKGSW